MSQFFQINPDRHKPRLIHQAVEILNNGGVIVYPTDSTYALGCRMGDKKAVERIRKIRQLHENHNFTIFCKDLSNLAVYAQVNNTQYRMLKNNTPGPYTFILKGTREVPRKLMHHKRKTIGIRIPSCRIVLLLLSELDSPIISSTLKLPSEELPMIDPLDIRNTLGTTVDLIIDGGFRGFEPTTIICLMGDYPEVLRVGKGDPEPFHELIPKNKKKRQACKH